MKEKKQFPITMIYFQKWMTKNSWSAVILPHSQHIKYHKWTEFSVHVLNRPRFAKSCYLLNRTLASDIFFVDVSTLIDSLIITGLQYRKALPSIWATKERSEAWEKEAEEICRESFNYSRRNVKLWANWQRDPWGWTITPFFFWKRRNGLGKFQTLNEKNTGLN